MNIKRYVAPDMRRAINMVRTEHGPDAVILSSDSVDGGVEIIAAVDYDQALVARAFGQPAKAEDKPSEEPTSAEPSLSFRAEGKSTPPPERTSAVPGAFEKAMAEAAEKAAETSAAHVAAAPPTRRAQPAATAPAANAAA